MSWYHRWRNVFRPQHLADEIDDEFQYHLAETVDRLIAAGMHPDDALREARRRLGNYTIQKERTRDVNIAAWLDGTRADLIYAARQLRSNPGFAAVAVLSLTLGIGANTAIFQLENALRLKQLPLRNPDELAAIDFEKGAARAGWWPAGADATMTYPEWDQIRAQQQAFSGLPAWSPAWFNLTNGGEPRFAEGLYVSGDFFEVLGVRAALGRTFTTEDDRATCNAGAVISHSFWQREFGGDAAVLGHAVSLDGHSFPIVGVTPPSFFGIEVGHRYDAAIPLCADRLLAEDGVGRIPVRHCWWLRAIGRLKSGWTVQGATAHLRVLSPTIMEATLPPGYNPGLAKQYLANKLIAVDAGTGVSGLRERYKRPLWLLMATAGLVLLIACANLANLLLARATVREQEIAVRLAVGASRSRVIRQLLAESMLLALSGAALGAGLAVTLSRVLVELISSPRNPVFVDVAMDWRVLGFAVGVATLTCLLFGLLPAVQGTMISPSAAMRSGGRSVTAGRARSALRRALVAVQVAFSLVLLFGALLFERSLHNLLTADPGFRPEGLLTVNIDFSKAQYPQERRVAIYREFLDRLSAIPSVTSASQVSFTPVSGGTWDNLAAPGNASATTSGKQSYFNSAGPRYFRTMGTRLIAGRDFDDHDTVSTPKVAIVNEAFARKFFAGANPIGRTFHQAADAGRPEPAFQIVGLVANTKYRELREDFRPIAFFPLAQDEHPGTQATYVLRIAGPPAQVINRAKAEVRAMSSTIALEFVPLSAQLHDSLLREKLMATLSGSFGLLAGVVATLGLDGVIAYMVARRRNEFGVRMALGATSSDVVRLVLGEAVGLVAAGLGLGGALAILAGGRHTLVRRPTLRRALADCCRRRAGHHCADCQLRAGQAGCQQRSAGSSSARMIRTSASRRVELRAS
jgi:putative ABC transport system permease protein